MAYTTLYGPPGFDAQSAISPWTSLTPVTPTAPAGPGGDFSAVLQSGFTLFLARNVSAGDIDVDALAKGLGASEEQSKVRPYYDEKKLTMSQTSLSFDSGVPLYVPIYETLNPVVYFAELASSIDNVFADIAASSATSSTTEPVPAGATPSTKASGSSTAIETTSSPALSSASPSIPQNSSSSSGISQADFSGAVAGGVIGGIVAGVAVCFCIFLCCFRKRSQVAASQGGSSGHESTSVHYLPKDEVRESGGNENFVTGWQKHLPQDKSDRTVRDALDTLFQHIHMLVDGYYGGKPWSALTGGGIDSLDIVSQHRLSSALKEASDSRPILESILARWIIHRISLRSSAADSLLPSEYTSMPATYGWHMEKDDDDTGVSRSAKYGFPQAFSQWRNLTAFIRPDPLNDDDFGKALDMKIDQALQTLSKALSPWELSGKSSTNRTESLRGILERASQAGILIFGQRSLYVFNWSSGEKEWDRSLVKTPAVVKEIDETGELLHPVEVLISARYVKI